MILGRVRPPRDPVLRVRVFGNGNGIVHEVEAVLDTGYTDDLVLPTDLIDLLGLPFLSVEQTVQADGSIVECGIYQGFIDWDGKRREILVQSGEGEPLIGMGLIFGFLLTLRGEEEGVILLKPLDEVTVE